MTEVRKVAIGQKGAVLSATKPRRVNHYLKRALVEHRYETDKAELVPALKKPERLEVTLADATKARITSPAEEVSYAANKRTPLKFKGKIQVTDVPDEEEVSEEESSSHETPADAEISERAAAEATTQVPIQSSHSKPRTAKRKVPKRQSHGVIGMTRAARVPPQSYEYEHVHAAHRVIRDEVMVEAPSVPVGVHVAMLAVALVLMVAALGIEQQLVVQDETVSRHISFSFDRIVAQLEVLQLALFAHVLGGV